MIRGGCGGDLGVGEEGVLGSLRPMMPDSKLCLSEMALNSSNVSEDNDNLDEAIQRLEIHESHEEDDVDSNQYPYRPGEPDCIYYIKTGICGYGSNCRYNHPTHNEQGTQAKRELPERAGQPDCQYFLKKGVCKFGATCKYHHPRDRHDAQLVPVNTLGLPIRQDQKSCSYYMRTGACKFGVDCKFNHPQPTALGTLLSSTKPQTYGCQLPSVSSTSSLPLVGVSSWPLSNRPTYMFGHSSQNFAAYMSVILPASPGTMPVQQGCPAYMVNQGNINHQLFPNVLGPTLIPNSNDSQSSLSGTANFPERADQPDCQYYMKTGSCKYGSLCKYHHPKERSSISSSTLGPLGLPLRPGQPACSFYCVHGTCRFGPVCKFDHPLVGYYDYNMPAICYMTPWESKPGKTMKSEMEKRAFPSNTNKEDKNISAQTSSTLHISPASEPTQNNINQLH